MRITRFAARVAVVSLVLLAPDRPALARDPTEVPFTLDDSGLIVVPVSLGAPGGLSCVLDTGATRTIVTDRLAARMGLAPFGRAQVVSSAGVAAHDVVRLPPVTIGGRTSTDLLATVLPASRMRAIAGDVACVIGHDFLAGHDYTIDYEARRLTWDPLPGSCERDVRQGDGSGRRPPGSCERLALVTVEGRYVVELPQSAHRGDAVRLVPDSGASHVVLFRQPDPPPLPLSVFVVPIRGRLTAATGERDVSAMRLERLRVGRVDLKDLPAYLVDRGVEERTGVQGLLPLSLFARVSFNRLEGAMVVRTRD